MIQRSGIRLVSPSNPYQPFFPLSSVSRTPLHCAASCNNVQVCKFLVESGAAVFATTYSDMQTAADKCEEMEDGYAQCSQFLYGETQHNVVHDGVQEEV